MIVARIAVEDGGRVLDVGRGDPGLLVADVHGRGAEQALVQTLVYLVEGVRRELAATLGYHAHVHHRQRVARHLRRATIGDVDALGDERAVVEVGAEALGERLAHHHAAVHDAFARALVEDADVGDGRLVGAAPEADEQLARLDERVVDEVGRVAGRRQPQALEAVRHRLVERLVDEADLDDGFARPRRRRRRR